MPRLTGDKRKAANRLAVTAPAAAEEEHLYECAHCGQSVDKRNLGDVLHHEQPGHEPLAPTPDPQVLKFIEPLFIQDEAGRSDFHALRAGIQSRPQDLVFIAFDLLHLNGQDLRGKRLEDRRARLRELLAGSDPSQPIHFSDDLQGRGSEVFEAAERMGLEGIVSKRLGSPYRSGPSKNWLKVKTFAEDEFVVIGTSKGDRAPVALLAREDDGELTYAGGAMVTLPQPDRDRFWQALDPIRTPVPPIPMAARKETGWAKPEIRVRARYLRGEEMLRHATVTELTRLPHPIRKTALQAARASKPEPPLPNPKLDRDELRVYYEAIAPALLPWVSRRPLNLLRCSGRSCWFQRNENHPAAEPGTFAASIGRLPLLQKNGRTEDYLYIEDIVGLRACLEADTVEFHGWGSLIDDVEKPDRLVIDIDPSEELGFDTVRQAAFDVKRAFEAIDLRCFAMVTGGKGVHVVVPLTPSAEWPEVREFARLFCSTLADAQPERFTIALPKAERRGRIFLDYLRNQRTATAVLPYSVRARVGSPVAAPVTWAELRKVKTAAAFSIADQVRLVRRSQSKGLSGWGQGEQKLPV
jgi:bifunctional non-homologous end joining protein LigD